MDKLTNKVCMYRLTPHSSAGVTPFLLFKKRSPNDLVGSAWIKKARAPGTKFIPESVGLCESLRATKGVT